MEQDQNEMGEDLNGINSARVLKLSKTRHIGRTKRSKKMSLEISEE